MSVSQPLADVDMESMQRNATQAVELLKNLANEARLQVLCALSSGELSVSELNERIPLSQSALSQHLKRLRTDGLVSTRRESQTIYYSLTRSPAVRIIKALHEIYCER